MPKNKEFRLLVAGGSGFIGSNFIRRILKRYPKAKVLNYDKLTYSGNPDNVKDVESDARYQFVQGDVADRVALTKAFNEFKPDYVINFAAETHVDKSIHVGSEEFIRTNVWGVFNFLELVKESGDQIKKYVQVSTDEVYGQLPNPYDAKTPAQAKKAEKTKFTEESPFLPNVPYSATKAGGDCLCRAYHWTWKLPVVVTHCSNNYGPYQYPEKIIPFFILRMIEEKKLPVYGDGLNVRDWIHVEDHCSALELCLFKGKPGEVYNIGADNEMNNLQIVKLILQYFKRPFNEWVEFVPDRPGHDRRYAIDSAKIRRELGWKPKASFAKAFKDTINWYLDNMDWVNRVREKTGVFNAHIDLWKGHQEKIEGEAKKAGKSKKEVKN